MEPRGSHSAMFLGILAGLAFLFIALLTFPGAVPQVADSADYRTAQHGRN